MKVGVVGLGYVGLSIAIVFAEQGNTVIGVEVDSEKVEKLRKGIPTMFEPGIKEHLERALPNLHVSSDYSTLSEAKFIYVAVPTPTVDNRIDLSYVEQAALSIKAACPNSVIVIKSTVVPGTARKISALTGMEVVSNPEFTREGHAIEDTSKCLYLSRCVLVWIILIDLTQEELFALCCAALQQSMRRSLRASLNVSLWVSRAAGFSSTRTYFIFCSLC